MEVSVLDEMVAASMGRERQTGGGRGGRVRRDREVEEGENSAVQLGKAKKKIETDTQKETKKDGQGEKQRYRTHREA